MPKRDYYEILGLKKGASADEIKSAYRKLARQHHPDIDKSAGATERFKEISEGYQVLSDPQKKQTYDQFGHAAFTPGGGGGQGNPFGAGNPFGGRSYSWSSNQGGPKVEFDVGGFEDPFDLFEQIFGNMGGGSPFGGASPFGGFTRRPSYQMELMFDEAIHGVEKDVEIENRNAQGRVERKHLKIKVPAGVDNGTRMRFGDFDIVFHVARNSEFTREGADIFSEINVTVPQLVLGDLFEVNTVQGKVKVKVPPGTQPGSLVKLKGKGAPNIRGGHGDHYVRVNLQVPQSLSKEEKKLYEDLKDLSKKKKGWF